MGGIMPLTIRSVRVPSSGAPVKVQVRDATHPQAIEARVHRFANETTREGVVGSITKDVGEVTLGTPPETSGKIFTVDGFVLPFGDALPGPYEVIVSLHQNGQEVDAFTAEDRGKGTIGKTPVRFRTSFTVETA
jgi:hypothetical protein